MLLLAASTGIRAQSAAPAPAPCNNTFVKQISNIGNQEPRIFKDPAGNYFLTSNGNNTTFISGVDAAGNLLWTHTINFPGDNGTITDMIVDIIDGTLAAVVRGVNANYIFKYDYNAAAFNWIEKYPSNYLFQNIHQTGTNNYVVTGEILTGAVTIFNVDRNTGAMTLFQNSGVTGEFFSTYDPANNGVFGACRYYNGSLFSPSLFRYDAATGANSWINTYVENTAGNTCRIYPVAPVADNARLVQLSSGDPVSFNTYQTGPTDAWILKTDFGGNLMWTNHITIPGYKQLNAKKIINTATGYYLLIDSYNGTSNITDYFFVVKTDKNGKLQWANRYGISGLNTVISGVEDNGYLYLTALSQSYGAANPILFLKLDPQGKSDANCPYIKPVKAVIAGYNNTQVAWPTPTNPTTYANSPAAANLSAVNPNQRVYCATNCALPCSTLSGSLLSGVVAFYPFGYGSLSDLSGNGYNLQNPTAAVPTTDRGGSPNCAYRFNGTDFLTPVGSSTFLDNITTAPFSISLWYQPLGIRPVGNYELLIGRGNTPLHCPDTWGEWSMGLYDCRKAVVGFDYYSHWETSTMGCSAFMSFISNSWHHLAFVYDGTNYNLYRDGILSSTTSGPCGPGTANVAAMMLGVDYTGDLDDIVIYNRALAATEVLALMNLNPSCCDGVTSSIKKPFTLPAQGNTSVVKVFPNPTDGKVTVSAAPSIIRSISVYSNAGQLVNTYLFNAAEVAIDMKPLASGVYTLKVITDSGTTTEKVIKK